MNRSCQRLGRADGNLRRGGRHIDAGNSLCNCDGAAHGIVAVHRCGGNDCRTGFHGCNNAVGVHSGHSRRVGRPFDLLVACVVREDLRVNAVGHALRKGHSLVFEIDTGHVDLRHDVDRAAVGEVAVLCHNGNHGGTRGNSRYGTHGVDRGNSVVAGLPVHAVVGCCLGPDNRFQRARFSHIKGFLRLLERNALHMLNDGDRARRGFAAAVGGTGDRTGTAMDGAHFAVIGHNNHIFIGGRPSDGLIRRVLRIDCGGQFIGLTRFERKVILGKGHRFDRDDDRNHAIGLDSRVRRAGTGDDSVAFFFTGYNAAGVDRSNRIIKRGPGQALVGSERRRQRRAQRQVAAHVHFFFGRQVDLLQVGGHSHRADRSLIGAVQRSGFDRGGTRTDRGDQTISVHRCNSGIGAGPIDFVIDHAARGTHRCLQRDGRFAHFNRKRCFIDRNRGCRI